MGPICPAWGSWHSWGAEVQGALGECEQHRVGWGAVSGKACVGGAGPPACPHPRPRPPASASADVSSLWGFISLGISSFIRWLFLPSVSLFLSSSLFPFSFLCISVSFSDSLFFPFYFCLSMSLFSVSLFVSLFLPLPLCLSCSGSLSISGFLHFCLFLGKSHMAVRGSRVLGSGRVRPPRGCEGGAFRALSICLKNPGEAGSGSTPTPTHWRFQWAPLAGRPSQFCLQASRSHQVETFSGEPEKGVLTL